MLIAMSETLSGPGEHTGAVLVTLDGTRWTVGDRTGRSESGYYGFVTYTYAVTADAAHTHDYEGKRRKVRADSEACFSTEDRDDWTIDTLDGDWSVDAKKENPDR
ncbi:MAG: hypothetical protein GY769_20200 [bacterium]|nr:hypothetical protein [bacterium]